MEPIFKFLRAISLGALRIFQIASAVTMMGFALLVVVVISLVLALIVSAIFQWSYWICFTVIFILSVLIAAGKIIESNEQNRNKAAKG